MIRIDYNKPGAQEYTNSWAEMLAAWGIDYVKIDGMTDRNTPDIKAWSNAIRQSGRPMILDVTQGDFTIAIAPTLMKYANQWEFAPDVECYRCEKSGSSYPLTSWADVANRFNYVAEWQPYAGPGGFNDYDSLEIGNGDNDGLTPVERQTQMSLWALGAAPLILGIDLTHLDPKDLQKYLENAESLQSTRIRSPQKGCSMPASSRCSPRKSRTETQSSVCSTSGRRRTKSLFQHPPYPSPKTKTAIPYTTCGPARRRKQPAPSRRLFPRMGSSSIASVDFRHEI